MKTKILLFAIFTQTLFIGCVRFTKSESAVTKGITYENVEEGWEFKNNEWYYYGEKINLSPVIYTSIETIDSTSIVNLSTKNYKIKLHTQSTGLYETSEPNWKWDEKGWSCNGNHVKSFPPSFTRKITKTVVNEDLIKSKKTITIDDSYQVKDKKWVWGIKENCWILDGAITNLLPPYMMIKFTKKEITQPDFSIIKIFNKKQ